MESVDHIMTAAKYLAVKEAQRAYDKRKRQELWYHIETRFVCFVLGAIFGFVLAVCFIPKASHAEQVGVPVTIPVGATVVNIRILPKLDCDGFVCRDEWGQCYAQGEIENIDLMELVDCPSAVVTNEKE